MEKKLLEALVEQSLSTYQIAEQTGKSQTTIRYWLKKYSLSTVGKRKSREIATCLICEKSCKTKRAKYCSNSCQAEHSYKKYIAAWKEGLVDGNISRGRNLRPSMHIRRYLQETQGDSCSLCGWEEQHPVTGKVPTIIDHIDGNPFNTVESNLRVLCPNCHSLTETYGALNKGNGREKGRK